MERWGECSCKRIKINRERKTYQIIYNENCMFCKGTGFTGDATSYMQREADKQWEKERLTREER